MFKSEHDRNVKLQSGTIVSPLDTRQDVTVLIIVIFHRLEVANIRSHSL